MPPFFTCRGSEGGEPACKLGRLQCNHVEMRGMSLAAIEAKHNDAQPYVHPTLGPGLYDIMLVVDHPSREEDNNGSIFQSMAGYKFCALAKKAGLDPKRIFVTFSVRCKPPIKRKPATDEIKKCAEHLKREIDLIQPKLIMPLGAIAGRIFSLQTEGGVMKTRGKVYNKPLSIDPEGPTYQLLPTFHPTALVIRDSPAMERRVVEDLKMAKSVLTGQEFPDYIQAEYTVADTVEKVRELVRTLQTVPSFSYDTETTGLEWWKCPILCMSFTWGYPNKTTVVPIHTHFPEGVPWKIAPFWSVPDLAEVVSSLKSIFSNPKIVKVAHNAKFDNLVLWKNLDIEVVGPIVDTQSYHHFLDEKPPHGLKEVGDIEFGYGNYDCHVLKIVGKSKKLRKSYDHVPNEILWPYCGTDTEVTWRLYDRYEPMIVEGGFDEIYRDETSGLIAALTEAEKIGPLIDMPLLAKLEGIYSREKDSLLASLRAKTWPEFNPNSVPDVRKAAALLGYEEDIIDEDTASGYRTDKSVLTDLAEIEPFFAELMSFRHQNKMLKTYIEDVPRNSDIFNRVHYSFNVAGPETGRSSVRFYHQIEKINEDKVRNKEPVMRDLFIAADGFSLVYMDQDQAELRVMAVEADDKEMLRIFDCKEDIHLATTSSILGIPESGVGMVRVLDQNGIMIGQFPAKAVDNRGRIGKKVNFGLAYGSQGYNLIKTGQWIDIHGVEHNLTWGMLNSGMERWAARFKGVAVWKDELPDYARLAGGVVTNAFGRKRRFGKRLNSSIQSEARAAGREAINFPIQSELAHIVNRTIVQVHYYISRLVFEGKLKPGDVKLLITVHDSILYEVKNSLVPWFSGILRQIAERPIPQLKNYKFPISMGCGRTWTEAEMMSKGKK